MRLVTAGATLSASGSGGATAGPAAGTYTGPTYPGSWNHVAAPAVSIQITLRFTNARIGATTYTMRCNADEPTPVAGAYFNVTDTTATGPFDTVGVTTGNLSSLDCNIYVGNGTTNFCTKLTSTGPIVLSATDRQGVQVTYRNPPSPGAAGTLVVLASGQTLTSNTMGSGCVLGNGAAKLSSSTGGDLVFSISPGFSIWKQ